MSAPVLFLDVDGVLNRNNLRIGPDGFDRELVERLEGLLTLTGAKIVLSSTWRRFVPDLITFQWWLENAGAPSADVIGATPWLAGRQHPEGVLVAVPRGAEIQAWLDEHPGHDTYAVVDDSADAGVGHSDRFVRTRSHIGLSPLDVLQLLALLGAEVTAR